jgi:hypothetical protein
MGPYAPHLMCTPVRSPLQHIYQWHATLCQSRLYPPVRDFGFDLTFLYDKVSSSRRTNHPDLPLPPSPPLSLPPPPLPRRLDDVILTQNMCEADLCLHSAESFKLLSILEPFP